MNPDKRIYKLSVITSAKNDGYGGEDSNEKILCAIRKNEEFFRGKIDFSYLLVDWCSDEPFYKMEEFQLPFLRHLYVPKKVLELEGLRPTKFYEYFAKNVSIRRSNSEYVALLNSDILLTNPIVNALIDMTHHLTEPFFARPNYRVSIDYQQYKADGTHKIMEEFRTHTTGCDGCAGDFVFCPVQSFAIVGGYNETSEANRGKYRTCHQDTSTLIRMAEHGIHFADIDSPYFHFHHEHINPETKEVIEYRGDGDVTYINPPDWGFSKYILETISPTVKIMTEKVNE